MTINIIKKHNFKRQQQCADTYYHNIKGLKLVLKYNYNEFIII